MDVRDPSAFYDLLVATSQACGMAFLRDDEFIDRASGPETLWYF